MTPAAPASPRTTRGLTIAGMILVVVGMQVFIIQPGLIAIFVERMALSEDWAGYIASGEMAGIAAATIIVALAGARVPWRTAVRAGTVLTCAANLASIWISEPALFLVARSIAGFGCGFLISIGYSVVGLSANADRDFGRLISLVLVYGAAGIFILPSANNAFGLGAIMFALAVLTLVAIPASLRLPAGEIAGRTEPVEQPVRYVAAVPRPVPVLVAAALFFLGQGFVWAFLALIGLSFGIAEQSVANGLMVAQLAGIAGAFCLAWLGGRVSQASFLICGSLASFLPLLALLGGANAIAFGSAVTVFNFAANLLTPLLMAMAASADTTGRTVQRAAAIQMIALALGPAIAAPIAANFGFSLVLVIASALFAATPVAGLYARGKKAPGMAAV